MITKGRIIPVAGTVAMALLCLVACNPKEKTEPLTFSQINKEQKASLVQDAENPHCRIKVSYQYINTPKDSINESITRQINCRVLGEEYQALAPEVAVDSLMHNYVRNYQKEVKGYYDEEIAHGADVKDLPAWFNYSHELNTEVEVVDNRYINYRANIFTYQGGAHPNEWEYWMCFNQQSGKHIRIEDIIERKHTEAVKDMVLKELIKHMATIYPKEKITTVDDLIRLQLPNFSDLFLSENFKMDNDSITFLYNKYDIAPYVFGKFIVALPIQELEPYMIQDRN